MSTLIRDDYLRYYATFGGAARSGIQGTNTNEITLNDSTNATTSQVLLKNVATPVANFDAVNKSYVDGLVVSGVTWKNAATAATVVGDMLDSTYSAAGLGTITWVGVPTIDTVTVVNGNRIVVQNITASGDTGGDSKGIYVVTTDATNLVLTRATDAAEGEQANGAAIFVFSGSANNDKAFVVTNDTPVDWDGGVVFSIMSSVPAVVVGGSDTQVQYNNSGALGADGSFTYNKTPTVPVLAIGGAATGLTTLNLGTGAQASTIAGLGSGLLTISNAGAATLISTSANLTLQAATSGNVIVDTATNDWTFNGTTLSSAAAATVASTSANLTLQAATSGNVIVDTATNDWTFNGTTLSSAAAATFEALVTGAVSLFETTTSGTITLGNATAGTGTITIDGNSSVINVGPTTSGTIDIGSSAAGALAVNNGAAMTVGADSTSMTIGSVANSTSTTITGQDMNVGSATTTTTDVDGISINVGSTVTTSLDLLATGVAGAVVITGGDATSSGTVSISTTTATTATVAGGEIDLTAGSGNTTGAGGAVDINAGVGGATGAGGAVSIDAGAGGATSGAGGAITINAGTAPTSGAGGAITINAGTSTTSGAGGAVTVTAGDATSGNGGNISLLAGTGSGTNGNVVLTTGGANTASGVGTDTTNIISFNNTSGIVARMESDGRFYANAFQTTSDATHKTNITKIDDPLERIRKVEGYSYNWKPEFVGYRDQTEYGVTAQQLEEAGFEDLVNGKTNGEKTVNYLGLIPFLIEAVKELANKVEVAEHNYNIVNETLKNERKNRLNRRE